MFLIGATIFLLIVIFIGIPLIRIISRPLNENHPVIAGLVRFGLWVGVLSIATWPVGVGPLLFRLNCSYFTKYQVEPIVDARATGYLDERLSMREYVATHMDGLFLNQNVEDLVAGRIAFFEMKRIRSGLADEATLPYFRYSLMDIGSPKCSPRSFGKADGQGLRVSGAPGKCLGIEPVASPFSRFQIRVSGDINQSDGTTEIIEKSTNKMVAIFRSFAFSFYGSGSTCPRITVDGELYGAHLELTKLVFMDAKGAVIKASFR